MLKRLPAALLLGLLAAWPTWADEAKPRYALEVSGESRATLKFNIKELRAPDYSSARGVVETWVALRDLVQSTAEIEKSDEKVDIVVEELEKERFGAVVSKDLVALVHTGARSLKRTLKMTRKAARIPAVVEHATKITGEAIEAKSGIVTIDTERVIERPAKGPDGKYVLKPVSFFNRFGCVKAGDQWRIDSMQSGLADSGAKPDENGKQPITWEPDRMLTSCLIVAATGDSVPPAPPTDTAEKAARALITWVGQHARRSRWLLLKPLMRMAADKFLACLTLALKKYFEEDAKTALDYYKTEDAKQLKLLGGIAVSQAPGEEAGTQVLTFKAVSGWKGDLRVKVQQQGAAWNVTTAVFVETKAGKEEAASLRSFEELWGD